MFLTKIGIQGDSLDSYETVPSLTPRKPFRFSRRIIQPRSYKTIEILALRRSLNQSRQIRKVVAKMAAPQTE